MNQRYEIREFPENIWNRFSVYFFGRDKKYLIFTTHSLEHAERFVNDARK